MMEKGEFLQRLAVLVTRIRRVRGMVGRPDEIEAGALERQMDMIEADLEDQIDEYMANQYDKHNRRPTTPDIHGLLGNWQRRKRSGEE